VVLLEPAAALANRSDVFVYRAADPSLDAWRGAQEWAHSVMAKHHGKMASVAVTRHDYDEKGAEYLKEHECSNHYVPTPQSDARR
jgi:actin-related protein 5